MTETQRRIRAYKRALPELRERVIAVALLLVMSASMLASASFAWITLSAAPEVTGMATTVAANGNLEIALAQGSTTKAAEKPGESQVGDSSANEEQTIVGANTTWGNLVNVSDPTYGLSNIALRPALLSDYNRTVYPLNGASYGEDGRVVSTNERYAYASYSKVEGSDTYYFAADADKVNYGVRAISSVGYSNYTGDARILNYESATVQYYRDAQSKYGKIVAEEPNDVNTLNAEAGVTVISALEGLVTIFAQDKINAMGYGYGTDTKTSCSPYMWYTYQMMLLLEDVLQKEGTALLELANWQAYVASGDAKTENTFTSIEELTSKTTKQLSEMGVVIDCLEGYKSDLANMRKCVAGIKPMAEKCSNPDAPEADYYWSDIATYVNILVDINSTTINGIALKDVNGIGTALEIIGGGDVIVSKGVLKNIEQRLVDNDNRVSADVQVTAYVSLLNTKVPVNGTVYTSAYGTEPTYSADVAYASGLESTAMGDATAKDTYGMALDLWLRTNYPDAVLTLEGSAEYQDDRATVSVTEDGITTTYELYTITVNEIETDVYRKDGTWYYAINYNPVTEEDLGSQTPQEKYDQIIIGYHGENRIWEDWESMLEQGFIEKDATTQGAGSCFVFYADTPTEQIKIMEMLEAFNVAFINQKDDLLGTAKLNLDSAYINQGKVTVPLEVATGVTYTDESGSTKVGITTLAQNTPTMITAIVYLNGSNLKNENVLAAGELQGQLNIQFGTNSALVAPEDEKLMTQYRTITASVEVGGQTTTNEQVTLEYDPAGHSAVVTLTIDGEQPERISGFFVRVINSTQGTRGEDVTFVKQEDGTWKGNFTLTNPGSYVFNTLLVDGVQYNLHDGSDERYAANHPKIYIEGLQLESVRTDVSSGTYMTADSSKAIPVTVKLQSALTPSQVNAQFFSEDNSKQYTALLSYDSINQQWVGTANISSSGTYTLKYVSVDGQILDVPTQYQSTYILYLGLTARVSAAPGTPLEFAYTGPSQITMRAYVYDDSSVLIKGLSDVMLYYNNIVSPAPMAWNGQYYEGVFDIIQPGELTFQKLSLGDAGNIRNVNNAPTFMAISLETPSYLSSTAPSEQKVLSSGSTAKLTANLKNAETATVYAEIEYKENQDSTPTMLYIKSNETGNTRTFTLPNVDGYYTLNRLLMQQVYDSTEEKWYSATEGTPTADNSFVLEATNGASTKVIATYNIRVYYDTNGDGTMDLQNKDFTVNLSGTAEAPTGTLFNGYSHGQLQVVVADHWGEAITGVTATNSKTVITYDDKTDTTYGGYDGASVAAIDVAMTLGSDGKTLTADTTTFIHSGVYTATITVNVDGTLVTVPVKPIFTVATIRPSVKFTATNPTAGNTFTGLNDELDDVTDRVNSIGNDGYSITCYFQSTTTTCTRQTAANPSKATTGLYDAGDKFQSATCTIVSKGDGENVVYTYEPTTDGSASFNEQSLGSSSGRGDSLKLLGLGTNAQATELILIYNNNEYKFTLETPISATVTK